MSLDKIMLLLCPSNVCYAVIYASNVCNIKRIMWSVKTIPVRVHTMLFHKIMYLKSFCTRMLIFSFSVTISYLPMQLTDFKVVLMFLFSESHTFAFKNSFPGLRHTRKVLSAFVMKFISKKVIFPSVHPLNLYYSFDLKVE